VCPVLKDIEIPAGCEPLMSPLTSPRSIPLDTHGNGAIDREVALGAFELTSAGMLKRITPPESSILQWTWDRDRNTLLYTVARDTNGDRRFRLADRTDVLEYTPGSGDIAASIVDGRVLSKLLQRSK
jgi:hypothetical protein